MILNMLMDDILHIFLAQLIIIKTKPYWENLVNTDSQRKYNLSYIYYMNRFYNNYFPPPEKEKNH